MLTDEAEQVLVLLREARDSRLLLVKTLNGTSVTVRGQDLATEDADRLPAYLDAVKFLDEKGFIRQTDDGVFELTGIGVAVAAALMEEAAAEARVPDTCVLEVGGKEHTVTYMGGDWTHGHQNEYPANSGTQIGEDLHRGLVAFYSVDTDGKRRGFGVLLRLPSFTFGYFEHHGTVPSHDLDKLFKRPGLRSVRDCLLGTQESDRNGRLLYPQGAPWDAKSIDAIVEASDDPRAVVLADCERDILRMLYEARCERKPNGVSAAEVAGWARKTRFYSVRQHIRWTLDDLQEKELIRTRDGIHYEIEVRRMSDVRRVMAGLPSDQLFDAEPPAQQAAFVPESTNEFDAFLCYASEDRDAIVAPFASAMEGGGLKPWWAEGQIRWGDNLVAKVQEGLSRSRYVVLFVSNAFLGKPWPERELNTAMSMEIGGRTLVLPVLLGLTHDQLKARYPMVSAKLYQVAADYDPRIAPNQAFITQLVTELKALVDSD